MTPHFESFLSFLCVLWAEVMVGRHFFITVLVHVINPEECVAQRKGIYQYVQRDQYGIVRGTCYWPAQMYCCMCELYGFLCAATLAWISFFLFCNFFYSCSPTPTILSSSNVSCLYLTQMSFTAFIALISWVVTRAGYYWFLQAWWINHLLPCRYILYIQGAKIRISFFRSLSHWVPTSLISSEPLQSYPLSSVCRNLSRTMHVVLQTQMLPSETNQKLQSHYHISHLEELACDSLYVL